MKKYKLRHTFTYNGKRYDVKGNSQAEVLQKAAAKLRELEEGEAIKKSPISFRKYSVHCFETYRKPKVTEYTYERYLNRLNHCINDLIGDLRLQEITRLHCQEVLNNQIGKSAYQIKQVLQILRFVFKQAEMDGLISKSPCIGLVEPHGTKTLRRSFTEEEEKTFLDVCQNSNRYNIFLLSYYCGCRPDEARKLKGENIVTVDGRKLLHINGTKTKKSDRLVPLPKALLKRIEHVEPDEYLATNTVGSPYDPKAYERAWHSLLRAMDLMLGAKTWRNKIIESKLSSDLVPYMLRHTYCTNILQKAGVPLTTASKLMGHSSIRITADIYNHVDTDDIISAAELIDPSPKEADVETVVETN